MKKLLINEKNNIIELLYICDGDVKDYKVINKNNLSLVNNIYYGRVIKITKNNFAFIDIGQDKNAFLDLNDKKEKYFLSQNTIKQGDIVAVQVIKDAVNEKGAMVTTEIKIIGKNIIVLNSYKKVYFPSQFNGDKEKAMELCNDFSSSIIFRSNANISNIKSEYTILSEQLNNILEKVKYENKISNILNENSLESQINKYEIDEIITQSTYINSLCLDKCKYIECEDIFSDQFYLSKVNDFYNKRCWLKSGGYIIIDEVEACTVIDVNTGKSVKKSKIIHTVNKEAAEEICKQIFFRNISGIIIIDFINYTNINDQKELIKYMEDISNQYSLKLQFYGFTKLGLLEISRRRTNVSISKVKENFRIN